MQQCRIKFIELLQLRTQLRHIVHRRIGRGRPLTTICLVGTLLFQAVVFHQLENICHWITVMAPGSTVDVEDLPPEVRVAAPETLSTAPTASASRAAIEYAPSIAGSASAHSSGYAPASAAATHAAPPRQYAPAAYSPDASSSPSGDWQKALAATLAGAIQQGEKAPGERLTREFEATMIRSALLQTKGRRIEASEWLGWGSNTLTRKIHELGLDGEV